MGAMMYWAFLCVTIQLVIHSSIVAYEDYSRARRYILNLTQTTWYDARISCARSGGKLATLHDIATIPDLNFTEALNQTEGIFWIGINKLNNDQWKWDGNDAVTWTNWDPAAELTENCITANIAFPFYWSSKSCDRKIPYVCQFDGDSCTFTRHPNLTIFGHNFLYLFNKTEVECMLRCVGSRDYTCMSFEYSPYVGTCEFNTGNRWSLFRDVINLKGWIYFHRTCNFGEVTGSYTFSSSIQPTPTSSSIICPMFATKDIIVTRDVFVSSVIPVTRDIYVTHDVTMTQTEIETKTQIITSTSTITKTAYITPSPVVIRPSSSVFQEVIEELQEMETVIKEKRKTLTKISVDDNRPSATYVGYVAVIFMSSVFGSIVLFDVLTIFRDDAKCFNRGQKTKVRRTHSIEYVQEPSTPPPPTVPTMAAFDLTDLMKRAQNMEASNAKRRASADEHGESLNENKESEEKDKLNTEENALKVIAFKRPMKQKRIWRQLHWNNMADSGFDGSESASETTTNSDNGSNKFDMLATSTADVIAEKNERTRASESSDNGLSVKQEVVSVDIESNNQNVIDDAADGNKEKDVFVDILGDKDKDSEEYWKKGPITHL